MGRDWGEDSNALEDAKSRYWYCIICLASSVLQPTGLPTCWLACRGTLECVVCIRSLMTLTVPSWSWAGFILAPLLLIIFFSLDELFPNWSPCIFIYCASGELYPLEELTIPGELKMVSKCWFGCEGYYIVGCIEGACGIWLGLKGCICGFWYGLWYMIYIIIPPLGPYPSCM